MNMYIRELSLQIYVPHRELLMTKLLQLLQLTFDFSSVYDAEAFALENVDNVSKIVITVLKLGFRNL